MAIFTIFIVLVFLCVGVLFYGVHFDELNFSQIDIRGVSLRLNPKIVLTAEQITIGESNNTTKSDPQSLIEQIKMGFFILFLIDRVELKQINTAHGTAAIMYGNNYFTISADQGVANINLGWIQGGGVSFIIRDLRIDEYNLSARGSGFFEPITQQFFLNLAYESMYINGILNAVGKDGKAEIKIANQNITIEDIVGRINGEMTIDLNNKSARFIGDANILDIDGEIELNAANDIAHIEVKNATAKTLEPLVKILPLPLEVKKWIYGNTVADMYEAKLFAIDVDLAKKTAMPQTIRLDANALNTKIYFNDALTFATANLVNTTIENGILTIAANNAVYEDQEANVTVTIDELFSDDRQRFALDIKTAALFNPSIRNLVATYATDVDIEEIYGSGITTILLTFLLAEPDKSNLHIVSQIKNSKVALLDVLFDINSLDFEMKNSLIKLHNIDINIDEIGSTIISGEIDAGKNKLNLDINMKDIALINHVGIEADELNVSIAGEWNDENIKLTIADLQTDFLIGESSIKGRISDLARFRTFMPLLELLQINGGSLDFAKTNNQTSTEFNISVDQPLLFADAKPITTFNGTMKTINDDFIVNILNNKVNIEIDSNATTIKINALELDVTALRDFVNKYKQKLNSNLLNNADISEHSLFVFGENSTIRYNGKRFLTDWFSAYKIGGRTDYTMRYKDASLTVTKNQSDLTINANHIGAKWVKELSGIDMSGGTWSLNGYGSLNNMDLHTIIYIDHTTIEKAALLTNVIALINTIPSLAQFRNPGFTAKGFLVEKGVAEIYFSDGKLFLGSLRLIGTNTDILAQGTIDFNTEEVDIYASIESIKSVSNLLSKIPIVGYIVLGDNLAINNTIHISGTINDPQIDTQTLEDAVFYPLNIIKRTLTLPIKMFE
jgi:hypothetical protein